MFSQAGVAWFPQDYATEFYIVKGIAALVSTLLLLWHMTGSWEHLTRHGSLGQRLRYFTLLGFSVLVTGGSAEQVQEGVEVSYRNLGGMVVTILLAIAMIVSIREMTRRP